MIDIIITLIPKLFLTYILKRFMNIFFQTKDVEKKKERILYILFFILTTSVQILFRFPLANITINIMMIFLITQLYEGRQKKKIIVTLLVYGICMICDILTVYAYADYIIGKNYNEVVAYSSVFLISICEFVIERFLIKKKKVDFVPPYGGILVLIPVISIIILIILTMNNLNNQKILVSVSAGILLLNLLIFYLYDVLITAYLKLEENALNERQVAVYANQLKLLTKSDEKVRSLRHDMKHHLSELLILAKKQNNEDIKNYINDMQDYLKNPEERVNSGNQEIDSILNYMLNRANNILKKVKADIIVPQHLNIRSFDMNVIIGNLLENAITAAEKSQDKYLSVSIKYEQKMLIINIRNSHCNTNKKKGETYITTKKEKQDHGIGLENVRKIVNCYQGTMNIKDENQVFNVSILLYDKIKN